MNDLISRAERFARVCHEGQFRKGKAKEPYAEMDVSGCTLAPVIGRVKLGCASKLMRVLNRLLAPYLGLVSAICYYF